MKKEILTGVYKITNILTNKCYIGSSSLSISKRYIHKCKLLKGNHHSNKLQNSVNKYGFENFKFEIIELCEKDKCIEKEQYWIDFYNSYKNGYNCIPKAGSQLGRIVSIETRNRISLKLKGIKPSFTKEQKIKGIINKYKKVLQYDLNMNLIQEFKSQKETCEKLNIPQSTLSQYCNSRKRCKNYIFKYG